jgi:hypothetical protein
MNEENSPKASSSKLQTILINFLLLGLIGYLGYYFWQSRKPAKEKEPVSLAALNSYGQPAYIGSDLKSLVPYDIKIPFFEGCYLLEEVGGHMIFTLLNQVEVSLKDKALIRFEKNGIDILEGEITLVHPSGKFPAGFKVYQKGVSLTIDVSPITIQ